MSYSISPSSSFKKVLKKYLNSKDKREKTAEVIDLLAENGTASIPEKMLPHKLKGNYKNCWECHILPDLLLICKQDNDAKSILLIDIGSHSDLF